jgi:hypothetical protein
MLWLTPFFVAAGGFVGSSLEQAIVNFLAERGWEASAHGYRDARWIAARHSKMGGLEGRGRVYTAFDTLTQKVHSLCLETTSAVYAADRITDLTQILEFANQNSDGSVSDV